jgi:hypothetical protein
MILLEEESLQRPKLPNDPFPANVVTPVPSERLPDYDASQAQHPSSPHKQRFYRRLWQTRVGKLISYALAIYSAVFIVIGIPALVLVGPLKLFPSCVDPTYSRDGTHHTGSDGMAMTLSKIIPRRLLPK